MENIAKLQKFIEYLDQFKRNLEVATEDLKFLITEMKLIIRDILETDSDEEDNS